MTQKPYKCRVEYLESTGTQYIDTGIKGKNNIDFDYKCIFTNLDGTAQCVGGNWSGAGTSTVSLYLGLIRTNGNFAYHYDGTQSPVVVMNTTVQDTPYSIQGRMRVGEQYMVINGTKSSVGTISSTFTSSLNMYLFGINNNGLSNPAYMKLYYCKIYDNGTLVRDFIPVIDNSGRPAMYDQVSGQLFYNQGSGDDFTYGRQIIPVEYLESTGTQYIDTGVYPTQLTEAEYRCAVTGSVYNADSHLFGSRLSASSQAFDLAYMNTSPNGLEKFRFIHGTTTTQETTTSVTASQLASPHTYYMSGTSFKVDGSEKMSFTTSSFTGSYSLWLFGVNNAGSLHNQVKAQRVYKCTIWDNGTLVRDFIPCIDENLTPFMFDKVHNTVYLNAGTGQFKVGPYKSDNLNKKLLRKKLALMLATFKKKRKYYCEVEYLESNGSRYYIDTGYKANNTTKVEIKTQGQTWTFGGRTSIAVGDALGICFNANLVALQFGSQSINYNQTGIAQQVSECVISQDGAYINGVLRASFTSETFSCPNNLYLFEINNNGSLGDGLKGKMWYCRILEGDTLVRDFIPVLDWDMTPCMYDRVTEQLFYNAGSGNFTAGREIHQVEYLETDGTSFINTGYIPSGSTETEITTMLKDQTTSRFMFGCRSAQSNKTYACLAHNQNRIGYRVGDGSYLYSNGYNELNEKHTYKIANGVFYRDDVVINTACQGATVSPNSPLALLTINTNNVLDVTQQFIGNFYSCTIKSNNVLVRDYIPAIDENGVGFAFDRVSHTIYDNAGTGAFSYPAREVEYLQSDGARAIVAGVTVDDTCGYDVKWMALNSNDTIILGTKGSGDSRWVLSGSNNPNVNISWNTSSGGVGLGLNKIQTAQMNYLNDRKRILNDTPLADITTTLSANASTYNVGIFAGYWGASTIGLYSTCRIYYAKISKGTELIRDFIPMVKDGSPCLYDKIGGLYYFGTGTGSFTTGKIVEPEYE